MFLVRLFKVSKFCDQQAPLLLKSRKGSDVVLCVCPGVTDDPTPPPPAAVGGRPPLPPVCVRRLRLWGPRASFSASVPRTD